MWIRFAVYPYVVTCLFSSRISTGAFLPHQITCKPNQIEKLMSPEPTKINSSLILLDRQDLFKNVRNVHHHCSECALQWVKNKRHVAQGLIS